jgi:hypothetical protein
LDRALEIVVLAHSVPNALSGQMPASAFPMI